MQIHWHRVIALVLLLITLVIGLIHGKSIYLLIRNIGKIGQEDATRDELMFGWIAFLAVLVGLLAVIKICTQGRN